MNESSLPQLPAATEEELRAESVAFEAWLGAWNVATERFNAASSHLEAAAAAMRETHRQLALAHSMIGKAVEAFNHERDLRVAWSKSIRQMTESK